MSGGPALANPPSPLSLPDGFGTTALGRPIDSMVEVRAQTGPEAGQLVFRVRRTPKGLFMVSLPPGTYVIEAIPSSNGPVSPPETVVVKAGEFTRVILHLLVP